MIIVPAFGFVGLAFGLSEFLLNVFKHSRRHDSGTDAGSLPLIWIVILVSMLIGMLLASYVPAAALPTGPGLYIAGFTIFGIGALIRWYSIFYLGRFFTVDVRVSADHKVIDTGPYRLIRHPSYTGVLLEFIGFAICVGNVLSMVVILLPTFCAFLYRIRVEEQALQNGLGESYLTYMRRTKRLIPFVY
jgi:protein-S-isoprenylcysteine O-methyltransferase Ste14